MIPDAELEIGYPVVVASTVFVMDLLRGEQGVDSNAAPSLDGVRTSPIPVSARQMASAAGKNRNPAGLLRVSQRIDTACPVRRLACIPAFTPYWPSLDPCRRKGTLNGPRPTAKRLLRLRDRTEAFVRLDHPFSIGIRVPGRPAHDRFGR